MKEQFDLEWWDKISHHFDEYIPGIYKELKKIRSTGEIIQPQKADLYKQFRDCKYSDVICCFVLPEPIINYKQSNLWQNLSRQIEIECFDGLNLHIEDNMNYLLKQGIIHLSTSLTYSKDYNKHIKLGWQYFINDCIKHLSQSLNNPLFVYHDSCMELLDGINPKSKIIKLEEGSFKDINRYIKENYNININW